MSIYSLFPHGLAGPARDSQLNVKELCAELDFQDKAESPPQAIRKGSSFAEPGTLSRQALSTQLFFGRSAGLNRDP